MMLDQWIKVTAIIATVIVIASAVMTPTIGGIIWLTRLDSDVKRLQDDVKQLQDDVGQLQDNVKQLQDDVAGLQEGLREILDFLQRMANDNLRIWDNLGGHTHGADGRTNLPLGR